jgi:hypothetical protein
LRFEHSRRLDKAFATVAREKVDALIVLGQPLMFVHRERVAKLALEHRMPAIAIWGEAVGGGRPDVVRAS